MRQEYSPVVKNLTGHGVFDLMYSFFWVTENCEKNSCENNDKQQVAQQMLCCKLWFQEQGKIRRMPIAGN